MRKREDKTFSTLFIAKEWEEMKNWFHLKRYIEMHLKVSPSNFLYQDGKKLCHISIPRISLNTLLKQNRDDKSFFWNCIMNLEIEIFSSISFKADRRSTCESLIAFWEEWNKNRQKIQKLLKVQFLSNCLLSLCWKLKSSLVFDSKCKSPPHDIISI